MPLYEYKCECGRQFEAIRSIQDRHNVTCECDRKPELKPQRPALFIMAGSFKVFAHDGKVLHERQVAENSPPPEYRLNNANLVEV